MLVLVSGLGDELIRRTVDDAAGEAFDKVAKMLGLGISRRSEIEERARSGDPKRWICREACSTRTTSASAV
jgi:N6-L-threonylcarbamoyladenine synthase